MKQAADPNGDGIASQEEIEELIKKYDMDRSDNLKTYELIGLIRNDLKIPPEELSDHHIRRILR